MKLIVWTVSLLVLIPAVLLALGLLWNRPPFTEPPGFAVRLKTYLTTHVAETRDDALFPELRPRRYPIAPDALFGAAVDAAWHLGWDVVSIDAQTRVLQAVVTTPLWRFKDDVVARVQTSPQGGSVLYIRSESRVGKGDLGANTRHVLELLESVERGTREK